jgi:prevent-host-death family protein
VGLLSGQHDVIVPTMLGHNGGQLPSRRPASIEHLVDGLERLLDELGLSKAHLAGNSRPALCATLCDMRTVTHREMRNQSGAILRRVADGETIQVTNNGQVAALIVPPGTDPLADLVSRGQVRVARNSTSSLRSIVRRKGTADSQTIVADVRGRW